MVPLQASTIHEKGRSIENNHAMCTVLMNIVKDIEHTSVGVSAHIVQTIPLGTLDLISFILSCLVFG